MKYIIILVLIVTSCDFKSKEKVSVIEKNYTPAKKNEFNLLDTVLKNLNLKKEKCKMDWVRLKENPNNPEETIVVIPEIVEEGEEYFELNSYILIINSKTGEILNQYFESSKTNEWVSDAIELREITIDTAPYNVTDDKRAFGVRVRYVGSSQANPYENETISLFVKSGNELNNVLKNFATLDYHGEWETDCVGKFTNSKSILIISKEKTNDYFDILVKRKITESIAYVDTNGDCDSKENSITEQTILKYNRNLYKYDLH